LYLVNFMSLKDIELKLQKSFGSSYIIWEDSHWEQR
jgi:hypothetical protein